MPTRNVVLTENEDNFIKNQIDLGNFQDANQVIRAGLSLLGRKAEEDALKLKILEQEIQKGLDDYENGNYISIRSDAEHNALMDQLEEEAEAWLQNH